MDSPFAAAGPARLYSLLLRLRPVEAGTLMAFSGDMVHAAFLDWVRSAAPEVAEWLHDGNRRRIFTCSSLQFPLSQVRLREAEERNIHLPLFVDKTYTVRITLLQSDLFPLLYEALMRSSTQGMTGKREPFMRLGKRTFLLQEVVMSDDASAWVGFSSFAALVEQARERKMGRVESCGLEFASLTTFNRLNRHNKSYGDFFATLPLPEYVFPGLAVRWHELAPPELASCVQFERIEQYIRDDGVVIGEHDLRTHYVTFIKHPQKGFIGRCTYQLRGPDEPVVQDEWLTVRQQIWLLSRFAFYCGVGYKTAMGMGQTRPIERI